MVSGLVTSPIDQSRICFGEARPIRIASKSLMSICAKGISPSDTSRVGRVQLRHSFVSSPGCSARRCTRISVLYFQVGRKRELLLGRPGLGGLGGGGARVGAALRRTLLDLLHRRLAGGAANRRGREV